MASYLFDLQVNPVFEKYETRSVLSKNSIFEKNLAQEKFIYGFSTNLIG